MLVKIQSENGGWILIDGAKDIEYSEHKRIIVKQDEIYTLMDHEACDKEIIALAGPLPQTTRTLKFNREDCSYFILFSTVAFICDDAGKTLEALRLDRKGSR